MPSAVPGAGVRLSDGLERIDLAGAHAGYGEGGSCAAVGTSPRHTTVEEGDPTQRSSSVGPCAFLSS
jgi:hypothetical protein